MVSAGDALVQARVPARSRWRVELNGRNITGAFRRHESSGQLLGLLGGLRIGDNTVTLYSASRIEATLKLVNHDRSGPIFSGPHQEPFVCQTVQNGLAPALDADCSADTVVQYYYKSASSSTTGETRGRAIAGTALSAAFKPYDPSTPAPADVAKTTTSEGRTVNFIVRREVGTINRAVYEIEFLHEPGQPLPSPWARTPGWNGRVVYAFGGGCAAGYRQGTLLGTTGAAQEAALAGGYALATSTLNIFANGCNDRVSAETLSMVKEHFTEQYGKPVHTIGQGDSGGAMQLHLIAQNYPGLLDAIIANASFPDAFTYIPPVTDCMLLQHAFASSGLRWGEVEKTAVSGFATWRTCVNWPILDPGSCDGALAASMVYDPRANPLGARCDIYSTNINVLGRDKAGLVRRPLDNVGVQYGLVAFNEGRIDAEQFVDLNERIGGFDRDGKIVGARMQADPDAIAIAYGHGLVLTGGGGLSGIPIVTLHSYTDDQGDNHVYLRAFQTRSRLISANGNADNQVILAGPPLLMARLSDPQDPNALEIARLTREMIKGVDRWLDDIAADDGPGTAGEKIARSRPAALADGCVRVDGERIVERASYDGKGRCNTLYPPGKDPRLAAGAPLSGDILKCALKPLRAADYARPLSGAQVKRLQSVFPLGVCDYSKPGVGQQITRFVWQSYQGDAQMIGRVR